MVTAWERLRRLITAVVYVFAAGSQGCGGGGGERASDTLATDSAQIGSTAVASTQTDTTTVVDLVEVGGPGRLVVLEVPPADSSAELAEFDQHPSLLGSIGPYLFALTRTFKYLCGAAHPYTDAAFAVVNARTGEAGSLLSPAELAGIERELLPAAVARFNSADTAEPRPDDPDSSKLTALRPSFGEGRLALGYQFTASACYACSDELWSSYSRSVLVPGRQLPEVLREFEEVPQPVREFWRASPPGATAGWSRLEGDRETRLLAAEFGAREASARPSGPTYLVWSGTDSARTTVWIGAAPSGFVEVGRRQGVYLAEGGRVWTWRERRVPVVTMRCPAPEE